MSQQILQTRYDYFHNKRYHKLYEIYLKREEQKQYEAEMAQIRYEQENRKRLLESARDHNGDTDSRQQS